MKLRKPACLVFTLLLSLFCSGGGFLRAQELAAQEAPKPLPLVSANSQLQAARGEPAGSTMLLNKNAIELSFTAFQEGDGHHPGVHIFPAKGPFWDLSQYGHVEAKITNTGTAAFQAVMHISDEGEGYWTEKKMESVPVNPGETKTLKVIFGYQKGFQPGAPVKSAKIAEIFIYLYDLSGPHSLRIEDLKAAGSAGEKPEASK